MTLMTILVVLLASWSQAIEYEFHYIATRAQAASDVVVAKVESSRMFNEDNLLDARVETTILVLERLKGSLTVGVRVPVEPRPGMDWPEDGTNYSVSGPRNDRSFIFTLEKSSAGFTFLGGGWPLNREYVRDAALLEFGEALRLPQPKNWKVPISSTTAIQYARAGVLNDTCKTYPPGTCRLLSWETVSAKLFSGSWGLDVDYTIKNPDGEYHVQKSVEIHGWSGGLIPPPVP